MKLVAFTCPSCSAQLNVDIESKTATCQYCGATFPIEDENQHIHFDGAGQAGYEFEKGRQRAQAEAQQPLTLPVTQVQPIKKRKTWLWVLGWIFIFPVPLTILMIKKKDLNPKIRYGAIAAAWIIYLAIGAFGGGGDSENSASDMSGETAESQVVTTEDETDDGVIAVPDESESDGESAVLTITLVAGQENEYSQMLTMNAGTEFEESQLVYYVPAGTYEVSNVGKDRTQVSVYEGVTVNEDGWEEVANVGDIVVLASGEKADITVPDGYYIDIVEPTQIELVQK